MNPEPAPRERDQRLLQLADNIEVGFILRDVTDHTVLYANPAFNTVFGFDPTGPSPSLSDIRSRLHPDDRAEHASAIGLAESGERIQRDFRVTHPGGELRWVRFSSNPVRDAGGDLVRVAATFQDVSEHKRAEIALKESEALLQRTADALHFGLALRQLNTPRFLFVSRRYIEIMGLDPNLGSDPTVESTLQLVHPDDRAGPLADYLATIDKEQPATAELRIVQPSGAVRWLRVTSSPVTNDTGGPRLLAASVEDVTARKEAEGELIAARREAEYANRAKDEFLSRVSHELRTPLNAVLGFAQLMESEVTNARQRDAILHILRGGRHLLEMINDLLDLSSIEADRLEMSIGPVAIADLLLETTGLVQLMATENDVTIQLDPGVRTRHHQVLADRRRLRQVMLNLLSNAIKYNRPHGRVDIDVVEDPGGHLRISVTDTGIGIRAEDLHRLFSPFDRLGQQATDIEGTGIGLALSQQLVAGMGGRLEVQSHLGHGSTLRIVLPLADVAHDDQPAAPGCSDRHGDIDDQTTASVLYIEDNRTNARLMQAIVGRRPSWSMSHAEDGTTGLAKATATTHDLIFLDLNLPDMHGVDVLEALRSDPRTATTPVVIVSADVSPGQIERLRTAGAQSYLTKPVEIGAVLDLLDSYVREIRPSS